MQVVITVSGLPAAQQMISRVRSVAEDKDKAAFIALNAAGKVFDKNFMSEGGDVGGWAALKERTVMEREEKGFGGEHPILIRYGDLRRVVATSLVTAKRPATFALTDADGKTVQVTVQSRDGRMNVVASGEKAGNQVPGPNRAARPYWYDSANVQSAAKDGVVDYIVGELRRL